jgi:small GTP-binding protein
MKRAAARIILIALVIGLGWGTLTTAPKIAAQYQAMREANDAMAFPFLAIVGIGALLVLAGSSYAGWLIWRELALPKPKRHRDIETMSPAQIARETRKRIRRAEQSQQESSTAQAGIAPAQRELRDELRKLDRKSTESTLEVIVFGAINGGKSSLLNAICGQERFATDVVGGATTQSSEISFPGQGTIVLRDTPGLQEVFGKRRSLIARTQVGKADVVVFVIADDLRDFELDEIKDVAAVPKRVMVCFNKRDCYTTADADALHQHIIERLDGIVEPADVVQTQAIDVTQTVEVHKADGTTHVRSDTKPRDVSALTERLLLILKSEGQQLLLRTMLQRARELESLATEPEN